MKYPYRRWATTIERKLHTSPHSPFLSEGICLAVGYGQQHGPTEALREFVTYDEMPFGSYLAGPRCGEWDVRLLFLYLCAEVQDTGDVPGRELWRPHDRPAPETA